VSTPVLVVSANLIALDSIIERLKKALTCHALSEWQVTVAAMNIDATTPSYAIQFESRIDLVI
jgi:GTP:adenosylcobinamide-phosphate guanylyltransferase